MNEIHPDVTTCIECWILEPLGVYNCYSGVTTNQSEAFNTVLKHLQKWREVTLDSIIFSLINCKTTNLMRYKRVMSKW